MFRDPDGNLVNFFTPVTPEARAIWRVTDRDDTVIGGLSGYRCRLERPPVRGRRRTFASGL
ncbi:hypothetical protein OPAG_05155 [Rhodococcus opacus PD630]|nr:hypothetical protein Pd630_LPD04605 [Rhodococcus opacus PD630]EHI45122.1 hypothetical protein OPAG_05155 [Rhodococcus opacus PD630]